MTANAPKLVDKEHSDELSPLEWVRWERERVESVACRCSYFCFYLIWYVFLYIFSSLISLFPCFSLPLLLPLFFFLLPLSPLLSYLNSYPSPSLHLLSSYRNGMTPTFARTMYERGVERMASLLGFSDISMSKTSVSEVNGLLQSSKLSKMSSKQQKIEMVTHTYTRTYIVKRAYNVFFFWIVWKYTWKKTDKENEEEN